MRVELLTNLVQRRGDVCVHFIGCEAEDATTSGFEQSLAFMVCGAARLVDQPIHFQNEVLLMAVEVDDEAPKTMLTRELSSIESAITKRAAEDLLTGGELPSRAARCRNEASAVVPREATSRPSPRHSFGIVSHHSMIFPRTELAGDGLRVRE